MDISNYLITGKFLTAEDVKKGFDKVVITAEGEFVTNKFGSERLHIPVEYRSETKTFDCSKTNAEIISKVLGEDTKQWVGAIVYLETYKTKTNEGKLVDAINVKEAKRLPILQSMELNITNPKEELVED